MSLAVAAIHDSDRVTLVADTKVTWDDERRTRDVFREAVPKLVILRADVSVGVTGEDPHRVIADLVAAREESLARLLEMMRGMEDASFVVATLSPTKLWMVGGGRMEDRTAIGRAWAGDQSAYEHFQRSYNGWPDGTEVQFLLLSSMQWLTSLGAVPVVGGYTHRVGTYDDGFRFVPEAAFIGPWLMQSEVSRHGDQVELRARVPVGGDPTVHHQLQIPGDDPTRGAWALLVPEAGVGLLFPHERPWKAERIEATSAEEFIAKAWTEFGQRLGRPLQQPTTDAVVL